MENCEATRNALATRLEEVDLEIAHLQSQIAALEAERIDLYSRQNALEPIARLPPELLVKIISSYVTHLDHSDLMHFGQFINLIAQEYFQDNSVRAVYRKLFRPDIFTLCHVSRRWRHAALGCQSLWSHIQVQAHTSPEVLRFMWSQSGDLPVKLDFAGTHTNRHHTAYDLHPAAELVRDLLRDHIERFQSVRIYCNAAQLFDVLRGRAERLESLVAADDYYIGSLAPRKVHEQVLSGGTPNLRHLDLKAVTIPWSSALLSSPNLTHVAFDRIPGQTPETIASLLAFLRPLSRILETLKLAAGMPMEDEDMELYLSRVTDRTAIELSNLKVLHLHWGHHGPFMAILSLLRIPKDMLSLRLHSGDENRDLAEAILNFSSCGRSSTDYVAPQEVEIMQTSALCWRGQQFIWANSGNDHPRHFLKLHHKPAWIEIAVTRERSANSTAFRLPWSFSNLRSISIHRMDVPVDFWTTLAASNTLEIILVNAVGGGHSLLYALLKEYNHANDMHVLDVDSVTGAVSNLSLDRPAGYSADSTPFASLKAIVFDQGSEPSNPPGPGIPLASITTTFVKKVAAALDKRSKTVPLEEIRFTGSGSPVEGLDDLLATSRCVVWEQAGGKGALVLTRRDSGHT